MKQIKKFQKTPLALATFLLLGSEISYAQSKWVGNYYGLGIGGTQTHSNSSTTYGNSGTTPATGWSNGQFKGSVYNSTNTMQALDDGPDMGETPTNSAMPNLNTWANTSNFSGNKPTGVAMVGFNRQSGNFVWGGELRSTFGNFGADQNTSQSTSGTKSGSFSDGEGAQFTFTNYNSSITSPTSSPVTDWWGVNYSANYSQTSTQTHEVKLNVINAALARVGYSLGDTLIYAVGGLAQSSVKASSRTLITESVSGSVNDYSNTQIQPINGSKSYTLYNEQSKNAIGFAIGAGAEWLVNKDLSLRAEGTYYDLGNVSVNASTSDGTISYSTRQDVKAYSAFIALIKKF